MSLLLSLALLQATGPAAAPAPAEDPGITVIAERMKRIRLGLKRKGTELRKCTVKVSSGDPELDGYACQAVAVCLKEDARKRPALESCVTDKVYEFYRARRAAADGAGA